MTAKYKLSYRIFCILLSFKRSPTWQVSGTVNTKEENNSLLYADHLYKLLTLMAAVLCIGL